MELAVVMELHKGEGGELDDCPMYYWKCGVCGGTNILSASWMCSCEGTTCDCYRHKFCPDCGSELVWPEKLTVPRNLRR